MTLARYNNTGFYKLELRYGNADLGYLLVKSSYKLCWISFNVDMEIIVLIDYVVLFKVAHEKEEKLRQHRHR